MLRTTHVVLHHLKEREREREKERRKQFINCWLPIYDGLLFYTAEQLVRETLENNR